MKALHICWIAWYALCVTVAVIWIQPFNNGF